MSVGLSDLCDEVVLMICFYLPSTDIISLAETCQRYNELLCERKVVSAIDLKASYALSVKRLRWFFRPRARCENVTTLCLSCCYWLKSSDILWAVLRLPNLRGLYALDTELCFSHLLRILSANNHIVWLSWTVREEREKEAKDTSTREEFSALEYLHLWVKREGMYYVTQILNGCKDLQELELSSSQTKSGMGRAALLCRWRFPKLRSLVLNFHNFSTTAWCNVATRLVDGCHGAHDWHTLWIETQPQMSSVGPYRRPVRRRNLAFVMQGRPRTLERDNVGSVVALSQPLPCEYLAAGLRTKTLRFLSLPQRPISHELAHLLASSSVTHLICSGDILGDQLPKNLQHLLITCDGKKEKVTIQDQVTFDSLPNLVRMSAPSCLFLFHIVQADGLGSENAQRCDNDEGQPGPSRRSRNGCNGKCLLQDLVETAPNMQEFEMQCSHYPIPRDRLLTGALSCIASWHQLESLFLTRIPVPEFSFLVQVAQGCPRLRRLGLLSVGPEALFKGMTHLLKALPLLDKLQDFILEHQHVKQLSALLECLSSRRSLQRVLIFSEKTDSRISVPECLSLISKCPDLVFLFIGVPTVTAAVGKEFRNLCKSKLLPSRPALWAELASPHSWAEAGAISYWPLVHRQQMWEDPAQLSVLLPSGL